MTLGDLMVAIYDGFLATYGDPEVASVATAVVINDLLVDDTAEQEVTS